VSTHPPTSAAQPRTVLVVSQTFVPDPASVGQHMADVAFELARRGAASHQFQVRVYASARGYEDPTARYPRRENLRGADIRRFPFASFGKRYLPLRVLGTAVFHLQAFLAVVFTPRLAGIFFSTSPPLIGLPMCVAAAVRRVPAAYWAMDLNPDQLIALGKLRPHSVVARILELANRFILRRATLVIALDRFMAARLRARGVSDDKILVLPPWPHEEHIDPSSTSPAGPMKAPISHGRPTLDDSSLPPAPGHNPGPARDPGPNPFRLRHHLANDFVIMYSGNHSPSNPLTTLLQAAVQLHDEPGLKFLFVGGGSGKAQVNRAIAEHHLTNVLSLPYQPLSELKHSLTAADVHVVSLGEPMVGIIHPCKIYGAMTAARPVLYLGPAESHIADLLARYKIGVHLNHGDVPAAVAAIRTLRDAPQQQLAEMGAAARAAMQQTLTHALLCGQLCDAVESALRLSPSPAPN
jgi:colanic acid biosynthesis glycosyl transferase WcaI